MSAAKHIKHALVERDLKQKDLAKMLNVTTATVSKMIKNDNMGYNKAEEIAEILGYEIIWKKIENRDVISQNVNNQNGFIGNITQNNGIK